MGIIELHFISGGEMFYFFIDRRIRKLEVSSSKTLYKKQRMSWFYLFDKGKERYQHITSLKLNDEQFRLAIILSMAEKGYKVIDNGVC